jgi:sugar O-acyltransferase (sialic acid O-acetyltransferase NeuD family)
VTEHERQHDNADDRRNPLDLVVVGAGGHAREVIDAVMAVQARREDSAVSIRLLGVVADEADVSLLDALGVRHLGGVDQVAEVVEPGTGYVIGVGSSPVRAALSDMLDGLGMVATTVVHPGASCGRDVRLGEGCYLAMGARVTTNVTLGRHTHVNVNSVVSHDCVVGDFTTLSPGVLINGSCRIGERVLFGTGAVVLPGRDVGDDAVVGAGAVVTADVVAGTTVVGVPARVLTR